MNQVVVRLVCALFVLALVDATGAAVVCARKNGTLVLRETQCRGKETGVTSLSGLGGPQGEKGEPGEAGPEGPPGPAGKISSALPANVTLRGAYAVSASVAENDVDQTIYTALSFGHEVVLVSPHYIRDLHERPPECPGSAEFPKAAPGHLCIYEWRSANVSNRGVCRGDYEVSDPDDDPALACPAHNSGAFVFAVPAGPGTATVLGTWAVTGY